ncbi:chemosensory receptor a [Plakobranchus ocellatus]|uniref:Chemosensory receptor a n=1 Tax=Plakobranchus ocellatus TaxID=259542 RepID=A0AAV4B2S6_9GAST|nr:chemosensory receptor a [Plakobranchus ocellatus]
MANSAAWNTSTTVLFALPYKQEGQLINSVLMPTWTVIILFGLLANLVNIIIFMKSGIKDSVTTLLCSLAVSDLSFLTLIVPFVTSSIIIRFAPNWVWPFDRNIMFFLFYWPALTLYDFSCYISVATGVTRCACVAMPLQFKSVFTKARTVKLVIALFIVAVLLRVPVLTLFDIALRQNPLSNNTEPYLVYSNLETRVKINDLLNRQTLPYINFIIMIACVIILTIKLHEATRIRRSHAAHSHTENPTWHPKDLKQPDAQRMSAKDIQVVQSVVLVCSIFVISQLPFSLFSTVRLIEPEFNDKGYYHYMFTACTAFSYTCYFLNASVNIFVYYRYNSKYRAALLSVLKRKAACDQLSNMK